MAPFNVSKADACHSQLISFRIWTSFAPLLPAPPTHPNLHTTYIPLLTTSTPSLRPYLPHLSSPILAWTTTLTLTNISFAPPDLLSLATLRNLTCLSISRTSTHHAACVTDLLVKGWAESAAAPENGFPSLTTLFLAHQPQLTVHALQRLASLPRLTELVLYACGIADVDADRAAARKAGWRERGDWNWRSRVQGKGWAELVAEVHGDGTAVPEELGERPRVLVVMGGREELRVEEVGRLVWLRRVDAEEEKGEMSGREGPRRRGREGRGDGSAGRTAKRLKVREGRRRDVGELLGL